MTRTDVMASSRPRTAGAGSGRGRRSRLRGLLALPVALLLAGAVLMPTVAMAASETNKEGLSGYSKETESKSGTSPSKETTAPAKETQPESSSTAPSAEKETLPFTGFDLRWVVGFGVVMMGAGLSIVVVQRRQRRYGGR